MDDEEFLELFHSGSLASAEFGHRGHLRLTWLILSRHGFGDGGKIVSEGIRRFATLKDASSKYHETITQFWLRIVFHAIKTRPGISDFEEFLRSFPFLLNKDLPLKHWSRDAIWNESSRRAWIDPDLVPLPANQM